MSEQDVSQDVLEAWLLVEQAGHCISCLILVLFQVPHGVVVMRDHLHQPQQPGIVDVVEVLHVKALLTLMISPYCHLGCSDEEYPGRFLDKKYPAKLKLGHTIPLLGISEASGSAISDLLPLDVLRVGLGHDKPKASCLGYIQTEVDEKCCGCCQLFRLLRAGAHLPNPGV